MAKMELTYLFEDPNPPKVVEQMLKEILLEKLLSKNLH